MTKVEIVKQVAAVVGIENTMVSSVVEGVHGAGPQLARCWVQVFTCGDSVRSN